MQSEHDVNKDEGRADMAKKPLVETTGKAAASAAARVLADPGATKAEKKAAASALTQAHSTGEVTGAKAAAAASKVLRDPKASKDAKTAAASALTQKVKAKAKAKKK
jgi:hypothetical protein